MQDLLTIENIAKDYNGINVINDISISVKPFQCPLCSYAAAYKGNLNSHIMSVHEKRKPFSCPFQCGYTCTLKSTLKRHKCS